MVATFRLGSIVVCSAILITLPLGLFLISTTAQAQYSIEVRTVDNGLPQNSVNAILQTRDGYLWLATNGGLARYDGVSFKTFEVGNTPAMTSNRILSLVPWSRSMVEDQHGDLWVALNSRLFRLTKERSTLYTTQDGLPDNRVDAVCEDRDGSLWVGTEHGLARLRDGSFTTYTVKDGLTDNYIRCITRDRAGNLWVGTAAGGLMKRTASDGLLSGRRTASQTRTSSALQKTVRETCGSAPRPAGSTG